MADVRMTQDEQRLKSKLLLMWAFLAGAATASTAYRTEVFSKLDPLWCPNESLVSLLVALRAESRDQAKTALLAFFGLKDRNYDRGLDAVLDEVVALSLRERVKKSQDRMKFEFSDAFAYMARLEEELQKMKSDVGANLPLPPPVDPPKEPA